jgi:hypothetical protein
MFAIMNIKTGKYVYGTDFRYRPRRQLTSKDQMLTYPTQEEAEQAFKFRGCGNDYRIVVLKTIEVKRIIEKKSVNS